MVRLSRAVTGCHPPHIRLKSGLLGLQDLYKAQEGHLPHFLSMDLSPIPNNPYLPIGSQTYSVRSCARRNLSYPTFQLYRAYGIFRAS